ncbi:MAG TPA: AmmeMemoRadiSam system protein B [Accumulibacter sp.]|nr:AmmeMemoRadiSam system protein B [Accumulibacter sp.]HMW18395.1 AmmeMemoRadiSam system protein B [Accumulibacter sp.]HNC18605.1 AmmeMemoRadiSam system protein B [Accumulibacter sp.]HND80809.1 AmmeMemoRadiSam system protein B [Accumulibacter sp.]HNE13403.1 AmmeMemoRadiSam system protein B [Accumulibacter sp.]
MTASTASTNSVRPAAVAGMFYPDAAEILARDLRAFLARSSGARSPRPPKAVIVPHAGYIYSGATAAAVYASLAGACDVIRRVVLLGPCHRVAIDGLALPSVSGFATPLGVVPLDQAALTMLRALPQVTVSDAAHALEHSLEVQLPFLQTVLAPFTLVPLAVGRATPIQVAEVIDTLWGGEETLIVVSSDLSHYLSYAESQKIDQLTAEQILTLRPHIEHQQACGATPVNGLLLAAAKHRLQPRLVALCNSGDTAGDKRRVVGYGAFTFAAERGNDVANVRAEGLGRALLAVARNAIGERFGIAGQSVPALDDPSALTATGATFVTLTQNGRLRGCIGSLQAHRPLNRDVAENAIAAAFHDRRFPPLTEDEWARTRVEVSLLTPATPLPASSEDEAIAVLRPGVDGVILSCGTRRATFLPQVWQQLPDARQFLGQLKLKAGLPADFWSDQLRLERYAVDKWSEE